MRVCQQIRNREFPGPIPHDPRIKAAVVADPLAIFFTAEAVAPITVPVQLWASELGGDGVFLRDVAPLDTTLSAPHEYHVVRNAGHFAFFLCPPALAQAYPDLCTDPNGFDRAAFHKEFNAAAVKFLAGQFERPEVSVSARRSAPATPSPASPACRCG